MWFFFFIIHSFHIECDSHLDNNKIERGNKMANILQWFDIGRCVCVFVCLCARATKKSIDAPFSSSQL